MAAVVKFTRKSLPQKEGLGEKLAKKRIAAGLDVKDIEKAIRIRAKYIEAIENNKYEKLPPDVYVRGFVRNYASYLKLDPDKVMKLYLRERGLAENVSKAKKGAPVVRPIETPKVVITPKTLTISLISLAVTLIVGYIFWQVSILTAPPSLKIDEPKDNTKIVGSTVLISGKTDEGATLLINEVGVGIDQDGSFRETINLQDGVNVIKIKSLNKLGKFNEIDRTIVASTASSVAATDNSQVSLKLTVGPRSASIQVTVDGKKLSERPIVVLAGVTQTYKANSSIEITTSDGGSVQATYNGKAIGAIGKDNETATRKFTAGMTIN